jgi:hypothetical protein
MERTLTIPDQLYSRLEAAARARGFGSVEQLIEHWESKDEELRQREQVVREIDALRDRLFARYGEMPDSVKLMRADRAR